MADDLHLHIQDRMNDCIRSILSDVADDLYDRAKAVREGKFEDKGAVEALEFAGQEIEHMSEQFR